MGFGTGMRAGDLDGGENESPGKAPPAERQGEERAAKLALDRARAAADSFISVLLLRDAVEVLASAQEQVFAGGGQFSAPILPRPAVVAARRNPEVPYWFLLALSGLGLAHTRSQHNRKGFYLRVWPS
jgi:hypothetical protein